MDRAIKRKRIPSTTLNIAMNLISFVITFGISFYITPFITKNVGMEAYGLIGIANNFTSYVSIITTALNSMASRFIIIQIHKNNLNTANTYFNSTLFANLILAAMSLIVGIVLIPMLDRILNISPNLIQDAKITFCIVFLSFSISLLFSVFSVGYYATNKLYVGARRTIESDLIRIVLLFFTFNFIGVKIQYTVAVTMITSLIASLFAVDFTKKNLLGITLSRKYVKAQSIFEMVKSGVWNSISQLSQVLLNGLDLIITNLFIGGSIQGSVSVAKTFSSIIISLVGSVSDVFLPRFLKAYAESKEALQQEFFQSTKILGFFSCMIISLFVSYSAEFYQLWLPGENWHMLWTLSCISLATIAISGPVYSMFSIYTVVNKVKPQAISTLCMSILSTATVFVLLKYTTLGVYAIVCTSAIYGAIKNLTYNMYYLKKYVGIRVIKFYKIILKNVLVMTAIVLTLTFFKNLTEMNSYFKLLINASIGASIACVIYFAIGTSMKDKKSILLLALTKAKKMRKNRKH